MEQVWELVVEYAPSIVGVIIFLVVSFVVSGWVGRLTARAMRRGKLEETLSRFLGNLARWAVLVLAFIACLGVFGVETTSFAAVIGASALAIGLAFQGSLSNVAAGVMLLIFRPFKVGDFIEVCGQSGNVAELTLFSTELDTLDNKRIIIPNGAIFGSTIENVTHHATRRVDVAVGVDYAADLDRTREVLVAAAGSVAGGLAAPPPQAVLCGLGDSSVDWQVRLWTDTANYWAVRDALTRAVKMALDDAAISIPFPQRDVHMDSLSK